MGVRFSQTWQSFSRGTEVFIWPFFIGWLVPMTNVLNTMCKIGGPALFDAYFVINPVCGWTFSHPKHSGIPALTRFNIWSFLLLYGGIYPSRAMVPLLQNYCKHFQFSLVYTHGPPELLLLYLLPEEIKFDTFGAWEISESCSFVGYVSLDNHTRRMILRRTRGKKMMAERKDNRFCLSDCCCIHL